MMDYYVAQMDPSLRPKVFGITASPVDGKNDIRMAMEDLQALLHAKIVTTKSLSLLEHVSKPDVTKWWYLSATFTPRTELQARLQESCSISALDKVFSQADQALKALGPWMCDRVLQKGLSPEETDKIIGRFENSEAYGQYRTAEERKAAIDGIRRAETIVSAYPFAAPTASRTYLSAKILRLHAGLSSHYAEDPHTRCIVFVEQRQTASLLADLFERLGDIKHFRPGVIVGVNGGQLGEISESAKHQEETMEKFRAGIINAVFATTVAEEGIDVPACGLVVKMEPPQTLIGFLQSRGKLVICRLNAARVLAAEVYTRSCTHAELDICGNDSDWESRANG